MDVAQTDFVRINGRMCNLLTYMEWLDKKFAEWAEEQEAIKIERRYRVPPSQPAPVVTMHHGKPKLSMMPTRSIAAKAFGPTHNE